jgi:hypothetical protein
MVQEEEEEQAEEQEEEEEGGEQRGVDEMYPFWYLPSVQYMRMYAPFSTSSLGTLLNIEH